MPSALEIAKRRLASVRADQAERGQPPRVDARAGQGNKSCSECAHAKIRKMNIGHVTITIGKPELRCTVDGAYRSPFVKNDCPEYLEHSAAKVEAPSTTSLI